MYLSIQQICVEHLLCVTCSAMCLMCSSAKDRLDPCPTLLLILFVPLHFVLHTAKVLGFLLLAQELSELFISLHFISFHFISFQVSIFIEA